MTKKKTKRALASNKLVSLPHICVCVCNFIIKKIVEDL